MDNLTSLFSSSLYVYRSSVSMATTWLVFACHRVLPPSPTPSFPPSLISHYPAMTSTLRRTCRIWLVHVGLIHKSHDLHMTLQGTSVPYYTAALACWYMRYRGPLMHCNKYGYTSIQLYTKTIDCSFRFLSLSLSWQIWTWVLTDLHLSKEWRYGTCPKRL